VTVHRIVRTESDIAAIRTRGFFRRSCRTLPPFQLIEATAARYPDRQAIRYLTRVGVPETDVTLNYEDFAGRIRQAANLFRRLGVTAHERRRHFWRRMCSRSRLRCGRRKSPAAPARSTRCWRPGISSSCCARAGAKIAIVLGENGDLDIWAKLVPALREAALSRIFSTATPIGERGLGWPLRGDDRRENADALDFVVDGGADENRSVLFNTGGTTGAPKLVLHTRGNQAFVGRSAALMYDLSPDDVLINGFPLFHVAGAFVYGLSVFAAGASIVDPTRLGMRNRAFVDQIWKQVARCGVTIVGGVPTVISALIAVPVDADISRLRLMLTGGSHCRPNSPTPSSGPSASPCATCSA